MFVAKVRNSPLGIEGLARRAGTTRFWVSRLLHYADACEAADRRLVRLAQLVGMEPEQALNVKTGTQQ